MKVSAVLCCCPQVSTDISVDSKHQTLQGVAFPLHADAMKALEQFRDKKVNYVQLVSARFPFFCHQCKNVIPSSNY